MDDQLADNKGKQLIRSISNPLIVVNENPYVGTNFFEKADWFVLYLERKRKEWRDRKRET